jgi:hypothetical protein
VKKDPEERQLPVGSNPAITTAMNNILPGGSRKNSEPPAISRNSSSS